MVVGPVRHTHRFWCQVSLALDHPAPLGGVEVGLAACPRSERGHGFER